MLESGAQEVGMLPQRERFILRDEDSRLWMEGVTLKTKRDGGNVRKQSVNHELRRLELAKSV